MNICINIIFNFFSETYREMIIVLTENFSNSSIEITGNFK